MSADNMTTDEMIESLTGFEELAITKAFGAEWTTLANEKPTTLQRSLVFVGLKREGQNDTQAKQGVMDMTLKACNDYFADEEEELMPEEPVTPTEGGVSPPEPQQQTSQPSVSSPASPQTSTTP